MLAHLRVDQPPFETEKFSIEPEFLRRPTESGPRIRYWVTWALPESVYD